MFSYDYLFIKSISKSLSNYLQGANIVSNMHFYDNLMPHNFRKHIGINEISWWMLIVEKNGIKFRIKLYVPQIDAQKHGLLPYKNIKRHTAHTIISWPHPKRWIVVHTSDLMMIIRQSNIFSQPSRGNSVIVHGHNKEGKQWPFPCAYINNQSERQTISAKKSSQYTILF